ncbi:MAG: polymerase sigma-70 factor, subfamily [Clostridia bacterium]|nr:polymerase sigma-70 factor, subfamily [Clostridia bacterium]
MEHLTDAELVALVVGGNKEAFAELVKRYQRQVYSLAYRLVNNQEDALDLSQDIFLKLYQNLGKYDPQRPFSPWLYRLACNVCYTSLRRRPQEALPLDKVIEFTPLVPLDGGPEDYYESREVQELVRRAIAELPENYRVPIVLRYLENLTYQQIADIMELPLSTIETRLYRGKALLQKRLSLVLERGARRELSRG